MMNAMAPLLFKAWRESRERFLISVVLLATICVVGVFCRDSLMKVFVPDERFGGDPYVGYIYRLVYAGTARGLFVIIAVVLALGGLQREHLHRTAGFTLALPVGRARLLSIRALLGLVQVAILSALPLVILSACSELAHVSYPLQQMVRFSLFWLAGGAVFYAVALLASTLFSSEFTALANSFVFMIFYPITVLFPPLNQYPLNIHHIMSGMRMPYFDPSNALQVGPTPWALLVSMLAVAVALVVLAIHIIRRQDYS
jgi:ABC-type transport system involved in multi-copper enzyme maturation permease subunit